MFWNKQQREIQGDYKIVLKYFGPVCHKIKHTLENVTSMLTIDMGKISF